MSFKELLSPDSYESLRRMIKTDAIAASWYSSVINPLAPIPQDATALMILVELLFKAKNDLQARLVADAENRGLTMNLLHEGPSIPRRGM